MTDTRPQEIHEPTLDAVKALFPVTPYCVMSGDHIQAKIETLRPAPPKSEAELLVDKWLAIKGVGPSANMDRDTMAEWSSLAQFVLECQRHAATQPQVIPETPEAQSPVYVYTPWKEWHGGECPVPGDWFVQARLEGEWEDYDAVGNKFIDFSEATDESDGDVAHEWVWDGRRPAYVTLPVTHYRVRFEVGKWYEWHGGECPVPEDWRVNYHLRDGQVSNSAEPAWVLEWEHRLELNSRNYDIFKFCIVSTPEGYSGD